MLDGLAAKGRLRALKDRRGLDFTSNDFLGLAESQALRDAASMFEASLGTFIAQLGRLDDKTRVS